VSAPLFRAVRHLEQVAATAPYLPHEIDAAIKAVAEAAGTSGLDLCVERLAAGLSLQDVASAWPTGPVRKSYVWALEQKDSPSDAAVKAYREAIERTEK
jgi:hypothetical protein